MNTTIAKTPFIAEITAFKCSALPVNPLPFINAMGGSIRANGMDWVVTDEAKAIMHTLNQMVHGQLYSLDSVDEYRRLSGIFKDVD